DLNRSESPPGGLAGKRPNSGPAVARAGNTDAVGATTRRLRRRASEPRQEPDTRSYRARVWGAAEGAGQSERAQVDTVVVGSREKKRVLVVLNRAIACRVKAPQVVGCGAGCARVRVLTDIPNGRMLFMGAFGGR